MSSYKWTMGAADDLQRIAEFIREYSPATEQAVIGRIVDRADILQQHPRLGLWRELLEEGTELRSLLATPRYRVIYEVDPDDNVTILQVLDTRSDNR